jgi:aminomethyltransferase
VVNASRRTDDLDHLEEHAEGRDVTIVDETLDAALLAVQGPRARGIIAALGAPDVASMKRFGVTRSTIAGVSCIVSRTGYTGEDGVELICEAGAGPRLFESLKEAGVVPAGLGARDALRMEMGYPLYGHELGLDTSPLEAGVGWAVSIGERDFVGRDALAKQAADGPARKLVGFVCDQQCVPMQGDVIGPGVVTSGGTSVILGKPIGLAFVPVDTALGAVTLHNRNKQIPCELRTVPLIDRRTK